MGFRNVRIGSITTVGDIAGPFSPDAQRYGKDFSISLHSHSAGSPWSGTIQVERSTDNGVSWTVVSIDAAGTPAIYTSAVEVNGSEPALGMEYRARATGAITNQCDVVFA